MNGKIKLCLLAVLWLFKFSYYSQIIPNNFYGVNGWMPDWVGSVNLNGEFYNILDNTSFLTSTGVKIVRLGGGDHDKNAITVSQAQTFATEVKAKGMEPLIQIPFVFKLMPFTSGDDINDLDTKITTALADNTYETYVKNLVASLMVSPYNVKYWSISNEPDLWDQTIQNGVAADAERIKDYFTTISDWIRSQDVNAIIVGPDLAEAQAYDNTSPYSGLAYELINGTSLQKITGQSATYSGKYYVDIWAFHTYPFNGTQSRASVVAAPSSGFASHLANTRTYINVAGRTNNLPIAITEFNITFDNDGPNDDQPNDVDDFNANSFLAGQWMAEMTAVALHNPNNLAKVVFVQPWSVHESGGDAGAGDLGLIHGDGSTNDPFVPRSTYIHYKWMTKNLLPGQLFAMGESNGDDHIKAFSSKLECNKISVVLMNQHTSSKTINVSFNNTYPSSGERVRLNIGNANPTSIAMGAKETRFLVFDPCGTKLSEEVYNETIATSNGLPTANSVYAPRRCRCFYVDNPISTLRCFDPEKDEFDDQIEFNNVTLNENLLINDSAYISGILTVAADKELTIAGAKVSMAPGA